MSKLVNKSGGTVTARDDAIVFHAMEGVSGVHEAGALFEHSIIDNNTIRIKDGVLSIQGRKFIMYPSETVDLTISNGSQGLYRNDLIVAEFYIGEEAETLELKVIEGVETASQGIDSDLIQEDTLNNGTTYQLPLYRVKLNGIKVDSVEDLRTYIPNSDTLRNALFVLSEDNDTVTLGTYNEYILREV